jgi:hypothetical protein
MIEPPKPSEFALFYQKYIDLVHGDVMDFLNKQTLRVRDIFANLSEEKGAFSYAENKWSIKELLSHCNDTERIMSYRALCLARAEQQALLGFDENAYATNSAANLRSLQKHVEEFSAIRQSSLLLFESFTNDQLQRIGVANGNPCSVRALVYICAGHVEHHLNILNERYLSQN